MTMRTMIIKIMMMTLLNIKNMMVMTLTRMTMINSLTAIRVMAGTRNSRPVGFLR